METSKISRSKYNTTYTLWFHELFEFLLNILTSRVTPRGHCNHNEYFSFLPAFENVILVDDKTKILKPISPGKAPKQTIFLFGNIVVAQPFYNTLYGINYETPSTNYVQATERYINLFDICSVVRVVKRGRNHAIALFCIEYNEIQ